MQRVPHCSTTLRQLRAVLRPWSRPHQTLPPPAASPWAALWRRSQACAARAPPVAAAAAPAAQQAAAPAAAQPHLAAHAPPPAQHQTCDYTTLAAVAAELRQALLPAKVEQALQVRGRPACTGGRLLSAASMKAQLWHNSKRKRSKLHRNLGPRPAQVDAETVVLKLRTLERTAFLQLSWHSVSGHVAELEEPPERAGAAAEAYSFGAQLQVGLAVQVEQGPPARGTPCCHPAAFACPARQQGAQQGTQSGWPGLPTFAAGRAARAGAERRGAAGGVGARAAPRLWRAAGRPAAAAPALRDHGALQQCGADGRGGHCDRGGLPGAGAAGWCRRSWVSGVAALHDTRACPAVAKPRG